VSTLVAPAKLTWSLRVLGVRDDGLHLLEAEMVTLDLADHLELTETDDLAERFEVRAETPANDRPLAFDRPELIGRALQAVGRRAHVALTKRIPIGAGLGGGSADAAAVLRWAGQLDPGVALQLGSDVPFCVRGGHATVHGVGELVEALEPLGRTVTLALLPFGVETAACYRAYDELAPRERRHPRNDLTAAAEVVAPGIAPIRTTLEERAGLTFELAGSGSTLFCEGDPLGLRAGSEVLETRFGPVRLLVARTD
jgi:4-diphosphocytidyl-2-C-methyl-D-erythritol kinase